MNSLQIIGSGAGLINFDCKGWVFRGKYRFSIGEGVGTCVGGRGSFTHIHLFSSKN